MHSLDDTIAAVATAPGGGGAGDRAHQRGGDGCGRRAGVPAARRRALSPARSARRIAGSAESTLAGSGAARSLPCDLYLWPTRRSFTRQPVAELHTLGSPPLLEALLRAACAAGARLAAPGEFTLRAFLAGRIDLVQAEAVLGVIDARDRRQLDVALAQMAGGLTRPLQNLRGDLLDLLADLEAGLDFAEEDIHFITPDDLQWRLAAAADQVARLIEQLRGRDQSAVEPRVVLVGWPNSGKSSLFNALCEGAGALVSAEPGTTPRLSDRAARSRRHRLPIDRYGGARYGGKRCARGR